MPTRKKRRLPPVGEQFNREFGKKQYHMTVVKTEQGVGYKVGNKVYTSPSAAAKAITNNSTNGWVFWKMNK